MSFGSWLKGLIDPCPHEWERVDTLHDREKNPTAATVIQCCKGCGKLREHTFRAPETAGQCRYRWFKVQTIRVYAGKGGEKEGATPIGFEDVMECQNCGNRKVLKR